MAAIRPRRAACSLALQKIAAEILRQQRIERGVLADQHRDAGCAVLEHDPEKWQPVFRKDHAPSKC
jgi:hypothetical protein